MYYRTHTQAHTQKYTHTHTLPPLDGQLGYGFILNEHASLPHTSPKVKGIETTRLFAYCGTTIVQCAVFDWGNFQTVGYERVTNAAKAT